jgi:hypothetical protein
MAKFQIRTEAQIAEEIRRRAQGAAKASGEAIVIPRPAVSRSDEPTTYGAHWVILSLEEPGIQYVEAAAMQVARIWDVAS